MARELGVSPATVKRWTDGGLLRAVRTVGGHRRFDEAELQRFRKLFQAERDPLTLWVKTLLDDPNRAVTAALHAERDRLGAWYRVADSLTPVVHDLVGATDGGEAGGDQGAARRLARALSVCSGALAPRPYAPRAILTTPEPDAPGIELSLLELCLRERGWSATCRSSGAARLEEIAAAVDRGDAEAVALAATARCRPDVLRREVDSLLAPCQRRGVALVVGGDGAWPDPFPYGRRERTYTGLHAWMIEYERASEQVGHASLAR